MTGARPEIGFADLLKVAGGLGALDCSQWDFVCGLLGLAIPALEPPRETDIVEPQELVPGQVEPEPDLRPLSVEDVTLEKGASQALARRRGGGPRRSDQSIDISQPWRPVDPPSKVLAQRRIPSLVRDAAATEGGDGPIDLDRLSELIASQKPIPTALPRLPHATLRRGAQVLLNMSEDMVPLRGDLAATASSVHDLIPDAEVWLCLGPPSGGGAVPSDGRPRPWAPPRPGTPIVLIGGWLENVPVWSRWGTAAEKWRAFIGKVADHGCSIHLVTPFGRETHPALSRVCAPFGVLPRPAEGALPDWLADEPALADLWRASPRSATLAKLASLAVRIEPALLRRLRETFCPEATVADEVILWSSDAVYARTRDLMEFEDSVQQLLARQLAKEPDLCDRARAVIADAHAHYPDILKIEEELRHRTARDSTPDRQRVDDLLAQVQRKAHATQSRGLAAWALRVTRTVPGTVERKNGLNLARWAARALVEEAQVPAIAQVELAWQGKGKNVLAFRRASGPTGGAVLQLPDITPIVLNVEAGPVGARRQRFTLGVGEEWRTLRVPEGPIRLIASDGTAWRLNGEEIIPVEIAFDDEDEDGARELARRLRQRGIPVASPPEDGPLGEPSKGARRTLFYSSGRIKLPLFADRFAQPERIYVTRAMSARHMPEPIQDRWAADLTLPATGLAQLIEVLKQPTWSRLAFNAGGPPKTWDQAEIAWEDADFSWEDDSTRPGPKSKPLPVPQLHHAEPGPVHFKPAITVTSHPIRPPLNGLKDWLRTLPDQLVGTVLCEDSRRLTAAASELARLPSVRMRFADGVFYYVGSKSDPRFTLSAVTSQMGLDGSDETDREHVRRLLQIGRCLVLIDGAGLEVPLTGPHGRTVCFTASSGMVTPTSQAYVLPMGHQVAVHSLDGDRHAARILTRRLQLAGVGVALYNPLSDLVRKEEDVSLVLMPQGADERTIEMMVGASLYMSGNVILVTTEQNYPPQVFDYPVASVATRDSVAALVQSLKLSS